MKKPVPNKTFVANQRVYKKLLDQPGGSGGVGKKLEATLESEFMRAWGFERDRSSVPKSIRMIVARVCEGFDHCTYYRDLDSTDTVIVTQPYTEAEELVPNLERGLSLGNWLRPKIVPAPEWAFYYPGRATLIVLKFPRGYKAALTAITRLWPPC